MMMNTVASPRSGIDRNPMRSGERHGAAATAATRNPQVPLAASQMDILRRRLRHWLVRRRNRADLGAQLHRSPLHRGGRVREYPWP